MKRLTLAVLATLTLLAVGCNGNRLFRCNRQECVPCCPSPVMVDDCCESNSCGMAPAMIAPATPAPLPAPTIGG